MLNVNTAIGATAFALLQLEEHATTVRRQIFNAHLSPAVNGRMNSATPGASWRIGIIRERNNQMKVVIPAIKGIDHNNVWEV